LLLALAGGISVANVAKQLRVYLLVCSFLVLLPAPAFVQSDSSPAKTTFERRDGQHDFDFEFGEWKVLLSRRLRPLTGSASWVEYEGTSAVRRVWNGRANLGELNVDGRAGHIEGLSLRLYNPGSHQWNISWANSSDGILGQPMVGEFKNGRGEFFNQEPLNGRAIFVRFIFSDVTPKSFRLEQAFSDDGGKSWEPNWIAKFTR
jgi:hypothetical protein